MKDCKRILEKARKEYRDTRRGYEYQKKLIEEWVYEDGYSLDELNALQLRSNMFFSKITVLEDVFGAAVLLGDE